jgi:hypothetical protein
LRIVDLFITGVIKGNVLDAMGCDDFQAEIEAAIHSQRKHGKNISCWASRIIYQHVSK